MLVPPLILALSSYRNTHWISKTTLNFSTTKILFKKIKSSLKHFQHQMTIILRRQKLSIKDEFTIINRQLNLLQERTNWWYSILTVVQVSNTEQKHQVRVQKTKTLETIWQDMMNTKSVSKSEILLKCHSCHTIEQSYVDWGKGDKSSLTEDINLFKVSKPPHICLTKPCIKNVTILDSAYSLTVACSN